LTCSWSYQQSVVDLKIDNTGESEEVNKVLIYEYIDLKNHLDRLNNFGTQYIIKINTNKTEVMTISKNRHLTNRENHV
jgi:hypothetical protein